MPETRSARIDQAPRPRAFRPLIATGLVALIVTGCNASGTAATPSVGMLPSTAPTSSTAASQSAPSAPSATPSTAVASAIPSWIAALGGRILFEREGGSAQTFNVMTVDPDGSDLQTIGAPSKDPIVHVVRGPAGRFLFQSNKSGQEQVYSMDASGGDIRALTNGPDGHGAPAVSPDGSRIAFDAWNATRDLGIHVADADGSHARAITSLPDPVKGADSQPTFSPDGRTIAFQRTSDYSDPLKVKAAIFVIGVDGTGLKQLTPFDLDAGHPRWSPDGTTILFADNIDIYGAPGANGDANLWTVQPDGTGLAQLTHETGQHFASYGSWAPDGSAIVFSSWFGDDHFTAIRVMKADGTDPTLIWKSPFGDGTAEYPEWSAAKP